MLIPSDTPIGIVGAGPGGLSAAFYLRSVGYTDVTVLEKSDHVGGKCHSPVINGTAYDMGALEVTPSYVDVLPLIEKYQLEMTNIGGLLLLDVADGTTYHGSYLTKDYSLLKDLALAKDIVQYFLELHLNDESLAAPGFHNISQDLAKTFASWLDDKGMSALQRMFALPVTCYGYGPLDQVAAAYVLKYLDSTDYRMLLTDMLEDRFGIEGEWPKRLLMGYQSLFTHMAADLTATNSTKILTSSLITSITRDQPGPRPVRVAFTRNGTPEVAEFGQLIMASLLTAEALPFMDLAGEELALLSQVKVCNYYTTLCDIPGLLRGTYAMSVEHGKVVDPPDGTPCMIIKNWDSTDTVVVYTYSATPLSNDEVDRRVRASMARMQLPQGTIHETISWPYFPHVEGQALQDGFYDKLAKLMGQRHTWYAGALMNFEDVQKCFEWSRHLVEHHFVGQTA